MLQTVSIKTGLSQKPILRLVSYHQVIMIHFSNSHCFSGILTFASINVTAIMNAAEVRHVTIKSVHKPLQQKLPLLLLLLQLLLHFLDVEITKFSTTQIARQPSPIIHMDHGSVTNLDGVTSVLIGRALDGIGSAHKSVPRFQHQPPKNFIVELMLQDISAMDLHQA